MKIAVNTRLLRKNRMDGIGWFTFNTLRYIVQKNPQIEFHFLFDAAPDSSFIFGPNVTVHLLFPPAKHAVLNVLWFEWSAKRLLNQLKPDLFISPDGILSLGYKGKQFAVIHDINFFHNPADLKFSNRKYYNYFFPKFADRAAQIATVSEYSKQDICTNYHISPQKIDVVYCGINAFYQPVDAATITSTRNKYSKGEPYFIFIGTLSPRKNIKRLMEAFDLYKSETGTEIKLLIVGASMYKTDELFATQRALKYGADIVFTGRLDDEELNRVLASALTLTFVPLFEGFGIPIIEAMICRVPVIASNVTSVPEVAGDAALIVDPTDTDAIKNAMKQIAADESLRQRLIRKGEERSKQFTWEKTAELLWQSILKCL
ncbi:glycosyltransferase involved in cell wall biosynthesis [Lacibacter cauensis]|uniref:Glycosyltransferase involved in cell wall biosynthesis n=1 Tax=Lacibacter cauensis TaxID=510947 RepID=A0A562SG79_9BACT|nr:glycosyltransferase family 1 protein [Lacibacter cauensis]TWI80347.1 glycosyltransferase involved in cell wall biosynthesis [Lacibacter cauensis]